MPNHTFIAETAAAAVEQIRSNLGPQAVVVSVRKLPRNGLSRLLKKEQIEVIASVDGPPPPPAVAPQRDPLSDLQKEVRALKLQFASLEMNQAPAPAIGGDWISAFLEEHGILSRFRDVIAKGVRRNANSQGAESFLRSTWRNEPNVDDGGLHLYVGVPGCGKSTVLCKMLAQTSLVDRHPATLYQLDTHVANSSARPAIFAEIVGAQFERTLPHGFERREESVFIDLPGVAVGDEKGLQALKSVIQTFGVPDVHLVLNAAYDAGHLLEQAAFFSQLGLTDLILSHLDEEKRWGKAWNLILGTNFAVRYLSSGQNVPGGLVPATADLLFHGEIR